ncbi:MAG TPA: TetR/AcrR family transcriptional regulator [Solirubrobacterales bacterium]|nr:TetR/AcrR family transcriptional regulator [Solirubrobacterales bacterium]
MTRPKRGEPRARTKIIEASRKLFARRGFSETSMGDIAKVAQVARATVYNNFDDKQDILAAIIKDYMVGYAQIPQKLRENARSGQTSFELVKEMVREALSWRVANADLRPIVAVARNLRGSGWEEANKSADDAMLGWVMAVHAADEAAGHIREEIDLEFGVRATYAMIEAILAQFPVSSDEDEINRVAHQLALLHWYSICSVSPEEAPRSPLGRKSPADA